ncbi:hypothetical protein FALBO_11577 [Fusarium albosuccineum]|uniref:Uncharacterized protein n=1 Tax=Fusarium albosuccineum TaxID=1237068 RepID=A0A8H4L409_9HYPO|nr:hypothetical protein FALBO_11577 [Fusarium albosuccineum]
MTRAGATPSSVSETFKVKVMTMMTFDSSRAVSQCLGLWGSNAVLLLQDKTLQSGSALVMTQHSGSGLAEVKASRKVTVDSASTVPHHQQRSGPSSLALRHMRIIWWSVLALGSRSILISSHGCTIAQRGADPRPGTPRFALAPRSMIPVARRETQEKRAGERSYIISCRGNAALFVATLMTVSQRFSLLNASLGTTALIRMRE